MIMIPIQNRMGGETLLLSEYEYNKVEAYAKKNNRELKSIGMMEAICAISDIEWPPKGVTIKS